MIVEVLKKDLIEAQKAREAEKLLVLRYLLSQIKNYEIELRSEKRELTDEDALLVLKRQVKRRKKAIEQFERGNRPDIVEKETAELAIVENYYSRFQVEFGVQE